VGETAAGSAREFINYEVSEADVNVSSVAAEDVTARCLLAFVVSVVEARTASALSTVVTAPVFIAAMVIVVRPAMVRRLSACSIERWLRGQRAAHRPRLP
jgi:Kef-type K+ transport system membrane component KefB